MGAGTKFQSSEKFSALSGVFPCSYRTAFNSVLLRWRSRVEILILLVFYHYRLGVHVALILSSAGDILGWGEGLRCDVQGEKAGPAQMRAVCICCSGGL